MRGRAGKTAKGDKMSDGLRHRLKAAVPLPTILRKLLQVSRRLWVRIGLVASLAVLSLAIAGVVGPLLPEEIPEIVGAEALVNILEIIASSMLAVTIFSLSVMVNAHRAVSDQWSPRARQLLLTDGVTMTTLATFLGAWLFALLGVIVMDTSYIGEGEVLVLFSVTMLVIGWIVFSIIRWIVHLEDLGSLAHTGARIEAATREALELRIGAPCLGGRDVTQAQIPFDAVPVETRTSGWVRHIYEDRINEAARAAAADVYLTVPIGRYVFEGEVIARVTSPSTELRQAMLDNVTVGEMRSFDQDPRFGFVVLGEIASKALSPGINDSGTAIDAISRAARILAAWSVDEPTDRPRYERLWAHPIRPADLMGDAFGAPARDGAGQIEVVEFLLRTLAHLERHDAPAMSVAAREMSALVKSYAGRTLEEPVDLARLDSAA